jgi:SAM-dependent methyltransferase
MPTRPGPVDPAMTIPVEPGTERPRIARLYDYLLGGPHNFAADREFARRLLRAEPNVRYIVAENRSFLGRAVKYLLSEGIGQFIDLGSGIPAHDNVHEIAQKIDPEARVVYVDNDPVVVAHGKHILRDNTAAAVIEADLTDPGFVVGHPDVTRLIDFSKPVGLLMVAVLHFVPDSDDPAGAIGRFASALAPGSHVVISHTTHDAAPGVAAEFRELYKSTSAPMFTRTRAEIVRLLAGFDLVEPGLVYLPAWRPEGKPPDNPQLAWWYAGVGRKA